MCGRAAEIGRKEAAAETNADRARAQEAALLLERDALEARVAECQVRRAALEPESRLPAERGTRFELDGIWIEA